MYINISSHSLDELKPVVFKSSFSNKVILWFYLNNVVFENNLT